MYVVLLCFYAFDVVTVVPGLRVLPGLPGRFATLSAVFGLRLVRGVCYCRCVLHGCLGAELSFAPHGRHSEDEAHVGSDGAGLQLVHSGRLRFIIVANHFPDGLLTIIGRKCSVLRAG